ncbi:MAG: DUF3500 domain-containing protein [Candidatus Hinthialibacter antarcticus]|nr:DUF3500 domain-containing protein [Candidatus Hinthialibacter antarcticus]
MKPFVMLLLCVFLAVPAMAEENQMLEAAQYFMKAFGTGEHPKMQYDLTDEERFDWHFIPKERPSITFEQMAESQRKLANAFVASGLSSAGYEKAMRIMFLEQILFDQSGSAIRNPGDYHITMFGEPSAKGAWGWRLEGHHISMNFTLNNGEIVSFSPFFMGTNPAEVREGPFRGLRVLGREEDLGRALLKSMSDEQRSKAIYSEVAPGDVLSAANPFIEPLADDGIAFSQLSSEQQQNAFELIALYAHRLKPSVADAKLKKIRAMKLDDLYFAWAGGTELGQPHYYRIQGPTFLIEYDNTQNQANHAHTVWRDPRNDFGIDSLSGHYKNSPHHQKIGLAN